MDQTPCRFTPASFKRPRLLDGTCWLKKKELAQEQ
jgi:hypothetical protein